ncbi:MAG: Type 1 glutamine amidotransferase-like domain-containing protein, partial [Thermomicrobiales bacterium]
MFDRFRKSDVILPEIVEPVLWAYGVYIADNAAYPQNNRVIRPASLIDASVPGWFACKLMEGNMKLLLTSAGIKNPTIHHALVDLLDKPIAESNALCIPTASYGHPLAGPARAWEFIAGQETETPMCELGWKSIGVLELTALPSLDNALWVSWVQEADVLLVNGGDALYLSYWMRESGLAELLPSIRAVYVGLSAGSMVLTP